MKQLYYALVNLLRGHGSNVTKVISLTLGLIIGIILFARVAFELSFNTGYKEADNLSIIMATYNIDGLSKAPMSVVMAPVPRTLMDEFPEEVEAATLIRVQNERVFVGDKPFKSTVVLADTLFFKTMGITVTSGSPTDLVASNIVFVSEDFARKTFGTTDVIGSTYMVNKTMEFTVRGTFEAVGENNSIRPDLVVSINIYPYYMGWGGGASFMGYVRLNNPEDAEKINKKIDSVIEKYMPYEPDRSGTNVKYHLENMRKEYISSPDIQRMIMVLSFLAFALLFIAAMNYVLIAISGLSRRAKGIGVHKCNGATSSQVFNMFLLETGAIILISIALVFLLVFNFKGIIEEVIEVKIASLFTLQTLWVPLVIVFLVFIVAGIIPGRIFSHIPVTQVFRKYAERNSSWKRILLFIQFAGVALVFGLLTAIYGQYDRIMNYDYGYRSENIAAAYAELPDMDLAKNTIKNLPMVESIALSELSLGDGWNGEIVADDNGKELFSTRYNNITPEYVSLFGFTLLEGRNVITPGEVLVNEEYIRRMHWTDGALGKQSSSVNSLGRIVGVMKDFVDNSLYISPRPVVFAYTPEDYSCISVKLREPFEESLLRLNEEVENLFPSDDLVFMSFDKEMASRYDSVKRFRDSAVIAFFAILFIALMGLLGYISDEMQRRSKEIAIRKINGAESWNVIRLLSRELTLVALPAIITGLVISYFIGREWLLQFAATRVELSIPLYILLCIILLLVIIFSVIIKSWRIANENPVISLRSE